MTQNKIGHRIDVLGLDAYRATPGRMGASSSQPDQISSQPIDLGGKATLTDLLQCCLVQRNIAQLGARLLAARPQRPLLFRPRG